MAISSADALERKLIAWACETYGFEPGQYKSCQQDLMTDSYKLAFTPRRFPPDVVTLANKIHDVMNDEFRGEILRAAVPDLSVDAAALADLILNPRVHVIDVDRRIIDQLMKA